MACLKLGSKSEAFYRDGQSWHVTSGLPSDIKIHMGDMYFHLHKFPLLSKSGLLEKLIGEMNQDDGSSCILQLDELPGGAKAFELVAKFCYGIKLELTAMNVASLRCAAEFLEMTDDYGDGNLITQTEVFLNVVFGNWADTIKALETCEEVLAYAEQLHIMSRCINSLAMKAFADSKLLNWPMSQADNKDITEAANNWWYEDVSFLSLSLYKRFIQAVVAADMPPENIAGSLVFYAKKYIPLMNKESSFNDANHSKQGSAVSTTLSEVEQRELLEEIVELVPNQRGVVHARFLLRLLRTAMALHASPCCSENLERRVGMQLDQAVLEDLLIPNTGYGGETLYDIDCFQRILEHFLSIEQSSVAPSPCIVEESQLLEGTNNSLASLTMVATLVDAYLADVAVDVNLKFPKFQALAAAIPDYARPLADGIYRAIDIYLKAHSWMTDLEREQICRLMNCQKLSLEGSTHAAQNERLPLRVIVQVLFFEQLRLRTSISSWFFVSDNIDGPNKSDASYPSKQRLDRGSIIEDMKQRVTELENECKSMKQEFQNVKSRRSWNIFRRSKSNYTNARSLNRCYMDLLLNTETNHSYIYRKTK